MTAQLPAIQVDQGKPITADSNGRSLCKVGGVSAVMIATLLLIEMIAYMATSAPSLADAAGWFSLFQNNRFVGLVDFGIFELYGLVLFVPMFLALYAALRRANESYMAIATILAMVGIAVNFATSKLFPILTLSDLYAAATTATVKSQFLAIGQSALAVGALGGIGGSVEGGIPLAVAGLIISVILLQSKILGRAVGYAGILANGTGLAMYINAAAGPAMAGSPFFGAFFLLSILWYFLIARGLLRMSRAS